MATKKSDNDTVWPAGDMANLAPTMKAVQETFEEFLDTASVDEVYGEPVREGNVTVIPTAEVLVGLGFGMGYGTGSCPAEGEAEADGPDAEHAGSGGGGGGGGAGRTLSRPVAVVVISPEGVVIEPVVDVTKIAIATITAAGFMMATLLGILNPKQMVKQIKGE